MVGIEELARGEDPMPPSDEATENPYRTFLAHTRGPSDAGREPGSL
jgi:hypothetical protein